MIVGVTRLFSGNPPHHHQRHRPHHHNEHHYDHLRHHPHHDRSRFLVTKYKWRLHQLPNRTHTGRSMASNAAQARRRMARLRKARRAAAKSLIFKLDTKLRKALQSRKYKRRYAAQTGKLPQSMRQWSVVQRGGAQLRGVRMWQVPHAVAGRLKCHEVLGRYL